MYTEWHTRCTDNFLAAKSRLNVISEKPMATRYDDGLEMVKACDDANVRLLSLNRIEEMPPCSF